MEKKNPHFDETYVNMAIEFKSCHNMTNRIPCANKQFHAKQFNGYQQNIYTPNITMKTMTSLYYKKFISKLQFTLFLSKK